MSETVLGLITARGGSKAVPRKNVREVGGKPLIAWTIEAAARSKCLDRIIVSTDDPEIAEICRLAGADVPFARPAELARDDSPHIDCVLHALDWLAAEQDYRPEAACLLQPTSPFRSSQDIDSLIFLAERSGAQAVVSVTSADEHPYHVWKMGEGGALEPFMAEGLMHNRRQTMPPAFFINGAIFYARVNALRREGTFFIRGMLGCEMPAERSLQIDTPWEFKLADLIMADANRNST